jgi:hypothetical protein
VITNNAESMGSWNIIPCRAAAPLPVLLPGLVLFLDDGTCRRPVVKVPLVETGAGVKVPLVPVVFPQLVAFALQKQPLASLHSLENKLVLLPQLMLH